MYTKSETEPKWPFCDIFPISEAATLQPCFGGNIAPNSELAQNLDPALESSWASIWQSSMHLFENLFQYACESDNSDWSLETNCAKISIFSEGEAHLARVSPESSPLSSDRF